MMHKVKTLKGYKLHCHDGELGKAVEFYFDDKHWTIRYLVADTGDWLTDQKVLLSPYALVTVNKEKEFIVVDLTKKQIERSPSLNSDKPVSRQFEEEYFGYYGWPIYWGGLDIWGTDPYIVRDPAKWKESPHSEKTWDPHLRSTHEVSGYHIQASNGEIGHVEDFIIDDETWTIRYLIIDTENWWPGKKILVSPGWIKRVSWSESKVFVNLSCEAIKQSPEFKEDSFLLMRDYEAELHRHYNLKGYWTDEPREKEHFH